MIRPRITDEQELALSAGDGVIQAEGSTGNVILMSLEVYRELMGLSSEEELTASVAALQKSMQEVKQGQTRPLTDALDDLGKKYEVQS